MRVIAMLLISIGCGLTATCAFADASDSPSQRLAPRTAAHAVKPRSSAAGGAGWTTVAGALAVVVFLILGLAKALRQRGLLAPGGLPREAIDVLGRKQIDYRHTIQLVRCGSRILVLASSPAGLTTLSEITNAQEVDDLTELCRSSPASRGGEGIGEFLRQLRTETARPRPAERDVDPTILRLKERLATVQPSADEASGPSAIREGAG